MSRAVKIRNAEKAVRPAIVHPQGSGIIQTSYLPDSLIRLVTMSELLQCAFLEELNSRHIFRCRRCCWETIS